MLPLLEAMRAGIRVISSNVCSLPEVGGGAALYFDPLSEGSISDALIEMISDRNRRGRLRSGPQTRRDLHMAEDGA